MFKRFVSLSLLAVSPSVLASNSVDLYQAPLSSLYKFKVIDKFQSSIVLRSAATQAPDALQSVNQTQMGNNTVIRYQQMYKGIPVVGSQVMVMKNNKPGLKARNDSQVNGHLTEEIQIDTTPSFSSQAAIALAKKIYFTKHPQSATTAEVSQLQIRPNNNDELVLTYLVSFKSMKHNGKPIWPSFVIDAHSGSIMTQWNNIKNYQDTGPGGNEKVHEYWYGKDGLPALEVEKNGTSCQMESNLVRLVNLGSKWDWNNRILNPLQYECDKNIEDPVNGAFSPPNDAYFFGHTIVNMYKDWYNLNALQYSNGTPMKLIMRVHFGQYYDNAFWDGQTMSFGDGEELYPLVSLDIAGHEVTHGFTEQHSNLEYHDEPGALNESLSDMAGQAARAYLLETNRPLYNRAHLRPDEITWGIGETVVRDEDDEAIRFMDQPSKDGSSADCLDKNLAKSQGALCEISYSELVAHATETIEDLDDRQDYIVHTASGIFNKAFYLISQQIGIKQTYHAMALANIKYWTTNTDFISGACGVVHAAGDLQIDTDSVRKAFGQVGVQTEQC